MAKDSTSPAAQNGESSVNTTQSSTSVAPSLAARVKRVNLPGEQMYPTAESSLTTTAAPISRHIERDVKGKGKDRLDPSHSNLSSSGLPHDHGPLPISREEYVRLLLQSLNDVGYTQAAQVLEAESGYVQEPSLATSFRQALLGGRWSEAIHLLRDLGVIDGEDCRPLRKNSNGTNEAGGSDQKGNSANPAPTVSLPAETAAPQHIVGWQRPPSNSAPGVNGRDRNVSQNSPGRRAIFMILRQKYLELVEAGQTVRALKVLRNEVAPVATSAAKLHALSGLMMCINKSDLYTKAKWNGAEGTSRQDLLMDLQESLPAGVIMPPRRLATLFDQARRYQELQCTYHTGMQSTSLLHDHRCQREVFPSVTTHVLAEHTDEVWVVEWSPDGNYLASGGKDHLVIIWKIEPTPTRACEKVRILKGHDDPVSALAWSPDGTRLVSAGESTLVIWDPATGAKLHSLPHAHEDMISQIVWSPDSSGFTTAAMDQKIVNWTRGGEIKSTFQTGPMRVFDFALTPDGKKLVALATNTVSKAEGSGNMRPAASRIPDAAGARRDVSVVDGIGMPQYTIAHMDRYVILYDAKTGAPLGRRALTGDMGSIILSKDGRLALISMAPDEVQLWNIDNDTLHLVRRFTGHQHLSYHIRCCFGGREESFIVSASEDSHIRVWQMHTGKLLEVLRGHSGVVNDVTWNPVYPDIFASCADDTTIRLWQPTSAAIILANQMHTELARDSHGSNVEAKETTNGSPHETTTPPQLSPLDTQEAIDMDDIF